MKPILILLLVTAACGPAFTAEESPIEKENNPPATSGNRGTLESAGTGSISGAEQVATGGAGSPSGGMANSLAGTNTGGNPPMAGGPAMGQGGEGGSKPLSTCLQGSDCSRACTRDQSGSDCQAALICWSQNDSFDNCQNFTSLGLTLAKDAVTNCGCH